MTAMKQIQCEKGHLWDRPVQRGRTPKFCPEHKPEATTTTTAKGEPRRRGKAPKIPSNEYAQAEKFLIECGIEYENLKPYEIREIVDFGTLDGVNLREWAGLSA